MESSLNKGAVYTCSTISIKLHWSWRNVEFKKVHKAGFSYVGEAWFKNDSLSFSFGLKEKKLRGWDISAVSVCLSSAQF